jgi:hypothetical protein
MSSPLAIAAVSAVLRDLLETGMASAESALGKESIRVTAVAPDIIKLDATDVPPQLNLFLYQITQGAASRNSELSSRSPRPGEQASHATLALDLHYLLTAYGRADFEAEILLGYAVQLLHQHAHLDPATIRNTLERGSAAAGALPPGLNASAASDLADQVGSVRVISEPLGAAEMSNLWSALQTHYRPSSAYVASLVLPAGT